MDLADTDLVRKVMKKWFKEVSGKEGDKGVVDK